MNVSLVIPAFNESANLLPLVDACEEALAAVDGSHEIVIVNDGSTDDTAEVLSLLEAERPLLRTILHQPGRNIGCHPSELEALKTARGDVALFLPADLQILPSSLPRFLAAAEHADVVASRRAQRADNVLRRLLSSANNRVERLLTGVNVHDAHSSMLVNRRTLDEVVPLIVSNSAVIPAELLVRARARGLRIAQVDVEHYPRRTGRQTGVKISEILRVQIDLLRLRRRLTREGRRETGSSVTR
ncbi:MAG: glycosyltransferase family 2 protein [Gaiellaceae bacterium]